MKLLQRLGIAYIQTKFMLLAIISKKKAAKKAFELFGTPQHRPTGKKILKNAEDIELKLSSKKIKGYRWNHPRQLRILILHGFGSAAHKFEDYSTLLAMNGFEVLAFDAPAHGRSDGTNTNALEYSSLIEKIITDYGPIHGFIAHSFGGISLALALEKIIHTHRTRVIFIAPATETTSAVDAAFKLIKLKNKKVRYEFEKIINTVSGKELSWFSMRRAMHNIKANVLWIHDEEDDITPWYDAEKIKQDNHPNIQFMVTKGLGHRKIYRDAVVMDRIVTFLKEEDENNKK